MTNDDDPTDLSDPSTDVKGVSPILAETPVAVTPEIELTQDNCPALFQKLIGTLGLTISAGFRQASGLRLGSEKRVPVGRLTRYAREPVWTTMRFQPEKIPTELLLPVSVIGVTSAMTLPLGTPVLPFSSMSVAKVPPPL